MGFQIVIIGMNVIGASIGLCLGSIEDKIIRVGVDRDNGILKKAQKLGAVDKTSLNIPGAVKDADVILLTEPHGQMLGTLDDIAPYLKPGVSLLDASGIKEKISQRVRELVPDFHNHASLTFTVNPVYIHTNVSSIEDARSDLFREGLMLVTIPVGTSQKTVELTGTIARLLDAQIMFADAVEVDGLQAGAQYVPQLLAATLLNITTGQPGWREVRKLVNAPYMIPASATMMIPEAASASAEWIAEKDNLIRYIDLTIQELGEIRGELASEDVESLTERITIAKESYLSLIKQRSSGEVFDRGEPEVYIPSSGETIKRLLGFGKKK
jgi:prephenate dehydrogenase